MGTSRVPIACIVPPELLKRIALSGSEVDRASAIETISLDHSLRQSRAEAAGRHDANKRVLASLGAMGGTPNRTIYDLHHETNGLGVAVRSEGQPPTKDTSVNQAYDGLGSTYKLYWDIFGRDSIDGAGLPLHGLVHYGDKYNNAMWDGKEMVFGDGDGVMFKDFTGSLDVIGHELTHGVTQYEANLVYQGQSGALNESISDVFGSLVKQYANNQDASTADWLIGAGIVGPQLSPALRSMKAPGTANQYDNQPADMGGYVNTVEDNGGVHANSGIPNRAFYLTATQIGGYAWQKAGMIWYDTLKDPRTRPNSSFSSFASSTVRQAGNRFGATSAEAAAVQNAWQEVKVL